MEKIPFTPQGLETIKAELSHLKANERPAVIQAISEAREHGDLSENAEYHAAREQQGFNEGRIQEIESRLADAQIIDITTIPESDKVIFGATVTLYDAAAGDSISYQIVGEDEADLKQGKISVMSPIARALIGKSVDDVVIVVTPGGEKEYEVSNVEHK